MVMKKYFAYAIAGLVCWCGAQVLAAEALYEPSAVAMELATYADYLLAHSEVAGTNFDALVDKKLNELLTRRQTTVLNTANQPREKLPTPAGVDGAVSLGIFLQQMFAEGWHGRALALAIDQELSQRGCGQVPLKKGN